MAMQASRVARFAMRASHVRLGATATTTDGLALRNTLLAGDVWKQAAAQRSPQQLMALLSDVKEPLGQRVGRTHNKDPLRVIASYTVTRVVQKAGAKGKAWGVKGSSSADTPNEREIYGGTKKEWVLLGPKVEGMGDSKAYAAMAASPAGTDGAIAE